MFDWTKLHAITLIPSIMFFILVSLIIRKWLIKYDEKFRIIPIHIITALIFVLEIIKQTRSLILGYDLSDLPLYYCSLFVFLYPLTSLYKGKFKDSIRTLTIVSGITLFGLMMIMPNIVYSEDSIKNIFLDFDCFHTVVFHNLVLLGTALLISLNLYKINIKKDYLITTLFYVSYCVIVPPITILLNENFNKFNYNTVTPIENIRLSLIDSLGYSFGQSMYVLLDLISTVGFSIFMYTVFMLIHKLSKYISQKRLKSNFN